MSVIKKFDFENSQIYTIVDDSSEVWFQGKSVALTLGYSNALKAIRKHVDEEDKMNRGEFEGVPKLGTLTNNEKNQIFINESGLYSLILKSKLETAKKFKKWVTSEVLPSIRKTGKYDVNKNVINIVKPNLTFSIQTEYDLHVQIINFIKVKYPNALLTVANGELQNDTYEKRIKSKLTGYIPGTFDILISNMHKQYSGFAIELKSPKGTGVISPQQLKMKRTYEQNGFKTLVSNDYNECITQIIEYMFETRVRCAICTGKYKSVKSLASHMTNFHRMD